MGKRDKPTSQPAACLILPSIYLGPCSAASSIPFLTANSITHVLSIGATPKDTVDGVVYHRIPLKDSASVLITAACAETCAIIDAALSSKNGTGRILVHCSAGISRSPSVLTAYLMRRHRMSLKAALGRIVRARPQVSPKFLEQLKDMEQELFGSVSLHVYELPKREKDRLALFESEDIPADGGLINDAG
ncbi:protein-tyrosine phosphatase-like protein [Mycena olivaceomarginata]|nr:protein-tyrosine phosphatase-like protein [Mycena olivaceomarginata]